jgi:hypothetical protein
MMIVVIPLLISLLANAFVLIYIRSSFRRVQCNCPTKEANINEVSQVNVSRHDIHLLRQVIYTFCVFIGGWGPVFLLMAIDFEGKVPSIVYIILAVLAELSLLSIIINLFRYNHKLRHYLKKKILQRD